MVQPKPIRMYLANLAINSSRGEHTLLGPMQIKPWHVHMYVLLSSHVISAQCFWRTLIQDQNPYWSWYSSWNVHQQVCVRLMIKHTDDQFSPRLHLWLETLRPNLPYAISDAKTLSKLVFPINRKNTLSTVCFTVSNSSSKHCVSLLWLGCFINLYFLLTLL